MILNPDARRGDRRLSGRVWLAAVALLVTHALLVLFASRAMGATTDEPKYVNAGRLIRLEGWREEITRYHGPIPFWCNQLFVTEFPTGGYMPSEDHRVLFESRLGTLPFAILGGLLVFLWSSRVFGKSGGLLSLAFYALNPLVIGYGALALVDVPHATAVVAALVAAWLHWREPSARRITVFGLCVGLALATKYLAALYLAPATLLALFRFAQAGSPESDVRQPSSLRRLLPRLPIARALAGTLLVGGGALLALYASYGFLAGPAWGRVWEPQSASVAALLELPVLGPLVQLVPWPFLQGLDFQKSASERQWLIFLDGVFAHGHPDYYLRTLLYKTPELLLFGTPLVVALRWLLGPGRSERERALHAVVLPTLLGGLLYLSFATSIQLGVRYLLPVYPLWFVLMGGAAPLLARMRAPRLRFAFAGFGLVWLASHAIADRSNPIAYFNRASGGQGSAFLHLRDTSSEFGQLALDGLARLRSQESEPFGVIGPRSGARFGRVAASTATLKHADGLDRSRSAHVWLESARVVRHVGAAWWLFEVTPEALEREARRSQDPLLRYHLALAWLDAGDRARAQHHWQTLEPVRLRALKRLARALDDCDSRAGAPPLDRGRADALVAAWSEVGRWDRVLELLEREAHLWSEDERALERARAHVVLGDVGRAIRILEEQAPLARPKLGRLLAHLYVRDRRYLQGLRLAEALAARRPALQDFVVELRSRYARELRVERLLL